MNNTTSWLVLAFLICLLGSIFYWQVMHKSLLDGLRFRLFAERDKLRRLVLEGDENRDSFSYGEVEKLMTNAIAAIPSISLFSFCLYLKKLSKEPTEDGDRFELEASDELKNIVLRIVDISLIVMALNSPILLVFLFVLWLVGKAKKSQLRTYAERFLKEQSAPTKGQLTSVPA